jgi:hypothetical protein
MVSFWVLLFVFCLCCLILFVLFSFEGGGGIYYMIVLKCFKTDEELNYIYH